MGREIDEIAGEELEIGMDGAEFDLAAEKHPGDARRLRTGIGVIKPAGDALVEEVEMLRQHDARLHHVEVANRGRVNFRQSRREEIGLLLVVAFEADPVAGAKYCLQEGRKISNSNFLTLGVSAPGGNTLCQSCLLRVPVGHFLALPVPVEQVGTLDLV